MINNSIIQNALKKFDPIALDQMGSARLMNRVDTKFIFPIQQLNELFLKCSHDHKILTINNRRSSNYNTLYYDTHDYALYHAHHAGKLNRYKIRQRKYEDDQLSFLEIKFKNNNGFTKKSRIKYVGSSFDENAQNFISTQTTLNFNDLKPTIQVNYQRVTLVNYTMSERITIDLDLKIAHHTHEKSFGNMVILEVKQEKGSTSPFVQLMKDLKIKDCVISKYCLGVSHFVDSVKKNNFKESNAKIYKLINS